MGPVLEEDHKPYNGKLTDEGWQESKRIMKNRLDEVRTEPGRSSTACAWNPEGAVTRKLVITLIGLVG